MNEKKTPSQGGKTPTEKPGLSPSSTRAERFIGGVIAPCVVFGLGIADFLNDGQVSKELIGAIVLLAFGFTGRLLDLQIWRNVYRENKTTDE